jgi:hypothetical protein
MLKEKGINESSLGTSFSNFKEKLSFLRSTKELEENQNSLLKIICDFSEASNKEERERVLEEGSIQVERLERRQRQRKEEENHNPTGSENNSPNQDQPIIPPNQPNKELERPTPTFKLSSQILEKFQSILNFNTREKVENLINLFKDNPKFQKELKKKHQVEDLNALLTDKTPQEIIILIKRFEYDKDKDKEIRQYYQLKENQSLTDHQINEYLYKKAVGELETSQPTNQEKEKKLPPALIIGGVVLISLLLIAIIWRVGKIKSKHK